ncbi:tRNA-dihydrouridine synthase [Achlya hypogyna]|uniref:tRNA-dihydrouridine(16/17) synthase [NAD(P)(+)] n=1 Tax=Achlya hypogyna TaxID=1202772 RepID=A0A1V9ZQY0_ACHHY|nr:tRNA-dihydrouridine synthase [Achlya hypogyna]
MSIALGRRLLHRIPVFARMSSSSLSSSAPALSVRERAAARGWELYRSLGEPKTILAPMVDQSELAYRMLVRKYGVDLCYTPMIHARMFRDDATYRATAWQVVPEDRPLFVQFCGNDPDILLTSARYVQDNCDAVDLNLGCPQGIARKGRYGAFLMHEPEVVREIVETLSRELTVPVSCKIRLFPNYEDTLAFCNMLVDAGCCWLVIHGRTKEMNKQLVRECDWDTIKRLRKELPIPVFANGGIENDADVVACLAATEAEGVMSSEGILECPALFTGNKNPFTGIPVSQIDLALEYMDWAAKFPPPEKFIRAHLFKMLFQELKVFTDLREAIGQGQTHAELLAIVHEMKVRLEAPDAPEIPYSVADSWYRRHRKLAAEEDKEPDMEKCLDSGFGLLFG